MLPNPHTGEDLEKLVHLTGRKVQFNRLATGMAILIAAGIGWITLGAALDMLWPLAMGVRVAVCALFWLLVTVILAVAVVWPALRRPRLGRVASDIERTVPGMHNRLITVLDLRHGKQTSVGLSPAFIDRLVDQTRKRLADYRVSQVADPRPVRRSFLAAGGTVVLIVALLFLLSERMPTALARVWSPTADIPPAAWVRIHDGGDVQALQGDPLTIATTLERGQLDELTLMLRANAGPWFRYRLQPDARGRFAFEISKVDSSFEYQFVGGGTWTRQRSIRMVRRPVIEKLAAKVLLPPYMNLAEPRPVPEGATQITAPVGSTLTVEASVSGEPERGVIRRYNASTTTTQNTSDREAVWFDDDAPPSAQLLGTWRWTSDRAYSGSKSHTPNWNREPYGFKTRTQKLHVEPGASVFMYVWLDGRDMPGQIAVTLTQDAQERKLVWGPPEAPPEAGAGAGAAPVPGVIQVGALPEAGKWVRLEVPLATIAGNAANAAMQFDGISFHVDKGRVHFDRVGSLKRVVESVKSTHLEASSSLPMIKSASGAWVGHLPIDGDITFAVEFHNALGHANLPMTPVPVVATADQAPTLLVEKPGKSVTLSEVAPMPVVVRAMDDWGVAAIGLSTGDTTGALGEPRWIATYDQPQGTRVLITAINPKTYNLQPGGAIYYSLVVRDSKGQTVTSEPFRLAIAAPNQAQLAEVESPRAFDGLLSGIAELLKGPGMLLEGLDNLLPELPDSGKLRSADGQVVALLNPDGSLMTADQIREMLEKRYGELTDAQKKALAELDKQLAEHQAKLLEMVNKLDAHALEAQKSALALPLQDEALKAMAEQLRRLMEAQAKRQAQLTPQQEQEAAMREALAQRLAEAQKMAGLTDTQKQQLAQAGQQLQQKGQVDEQKLNEIGEMAKAEPLTPPQKDELKDLRDQLAKLGEDDAKIPETDQAILDRLAKLNELTPEQQEEMERLKAQLEQMQQAQQDFAENPSQAQQQMQDMMAEMQAEQAMQQMQQAMPYMQSQRQKLEEMKQQLAQLQAQAEAAKKAAELNEVSEDQQKLDPEALEAMKRAKELMAQRMQEQEEPDAMPPAPWVPPGQEQEAMPSEKDTPETDPAALAKNQTGETAEGEKEEEEKENWWDKPVDAPKAGADMQENERFDDDNRPVEPPAPRENPLIKGKVKPQTPREKLREHQEQMDKALTENSNEMAAAIGDMEEAMEEMEQQSSASNSIGPQGGMRAGPMPGSEEAKMPGSAPGQMAEPQDAPPPGQQRQSGKPPPPSGGAQTPGGSPQSKAQQIAQMMNSPKMQQAMAMAARAMQQQQQQQQQQAGQQPGNEPGQQPGPATTGGTGMNNRPGFMMNMDLGQFGLGPQESAKLYRLPPKLREPLLQGMQEQGPEGYQRMIDAYYRELSQQEIK